MSTVYMAYRVKKKSLSTLLKYGNPINEHSLLIKIDYLLFQKVP